MSQTQPKIGSNATRHNRRDEAALQQLHLAHVPLATPCPRCHAGSIITHEIKSDSLLECMYDQPFPHKERRSIGDNPTHIFVDS